MDYDQHIFISYAHIDNQPLTPEQQGWITRFHKALDAMLSMRMGKKAKIWRDDKLRGNDVFADEITDQFKGTALLVSILTPRYVHSEWCTREITEFCQAAEETGNLVVDNKARVIKVLKAPVELDESMPAIVDEMLGYEFFALDDGVPLELDPAYGEHFAQDFNRKIGKLAWDAAQLLEKIEAQAAAAAPGPAAGAGPEKPKVYLAECSHDRRDAREMLEADLRAHGYTVLPHQRLPLADEDEYVAEARRAMAECGFAVHLVGTALGAVPDGPSMKSASVLQNELAAALCKEGKLKRVIWLPAGTTSDQEAQHAFIEALHQDPAVQAGADLITGDLEELKTAIHANLKALEKPPPEPPATEAGDGDGGDDTRLVYVVCVEQDRKATVPLRKHLKSQGFDVALPVFEGSAAEVRERNQAVLRTCEAAILFYGAGDEAWKRAVESELKKVGSTRAGRPLAAFATYLAEPKTADKEDMIDMEEPGLIDGLSGFDEASMSDFLAALAAARGDA